MSKAAHIQARLAGLLKESSAVPIESVPFYLHVAEWIGIALHYNEAANELSHRGPTASDLPRLLLAGHALECALKASLLAKGQEAPHSHDLVGLVDLVLGAGYRVQEPELVAIAHLNSAFSKDMISSTKYRVRYPTEQFEASLRDAAPQLLISRIVESLAHQATSVNDHLNRHAWSGVAPDA